MAIRLTQLATLPLIFALTACTTPAIEPQGQRLSAAEIDSLLQERSFTLISMKSGNELIAYASGEQCTFRYREGSRTKTVKWSIRGEEHCCLKGEGRESCGPLYDMGEGVYHKYQDGEHTHIMRDFSAGNRL